MADCEFCGSGNDVEAQDMGENRVMLLCASCRANINHGEEGRAMEMQNRNQAPTIPLTVKARVYGSYRRCRVCGVSARYVYVDIADGHGAYGMPTMGLQLPIKLVRKADQAALSEYRQSLAAARS